MLAARAPDRRSRRARKGEVCTMHHSDSRDGWSGDEGRGLSGVVIIERQKRVKGSKVYHAAGLG